MADLKINIIATDKASPSINKVAQAMQNIAQQSGVLSGSMGRLASQLGGLIGAGGMAGLSVAARGACQQSRSSKHEFADWATGSAKPAKGYDELDPKTQQSYRNDSRSFRTSLSLSAWRAWLEPRQSAARQKEKSTHLGAA